MKRHLSSFEAAHLQHRATLKSFDSAVEPSGALIHNHHTVGYLSLRAQDISRPVLVPSILTPMFHSAANPGTDSVMPEDHAQQQQNGRHLGKGCATWLHQFLGACVRADQSGIEALAAEDVKHGRIGEALQVLLDVEHAKVGKPSPTKQEFGAFIESIRTGTLQTQDPVLALVLQQPVVQSYAERYEQVRKDSPYPENQRGGFIYPEDYRQSLEKKAQSLPVDLFEEFETARKDSETQRLWAQRLVEEQKAAFQAVPAR